jgi:shikimate dehydrogenase
MPPADRYAVFGHPIGHTRSPCIHALFAQQTGERLIYTAQDVTPDAFETSVREFFANGGKGLNCTVPLKELAWKIADLRSEDAERSKAINTLALCQDGTIYGDNTDGIGLIRDLTINFGCTLESRRVLLLGAGGASRGIIGPLLEQGPSCVIIANRTPEKAVRLAEEFCGLGPITGCGLSDLGTEAFDLVLNATSASLTGELPKLPSNILRTGACCYDLAYGVEPTPFVRWGLEMGADISVDGIGMLVEQAAEAFFIWRGIRPDTAPVIDLLNRERRG